MQSLIEDISTLTTIPTANLNQLVKKANFCICNDVAESKLQGEDLTEVDIGIGRLHIFVEDNNIKYKFVPSKYLENNIKKTILDGKNPLIEEAEQALVTRIVDTYKNYI